MKEQAYRTFGEGPEGDARWMRQALQLAEQAVGMASPNPTVGCVLVKDDAPVGRGAHHYDRRAHAEIVALEDAGAAARDATAYVTLEPCSHTGRTPPCARALIEAGIRRVVAATGDPNAVVNGSGFRMLREAGIPVTVGILAEQARALNDGFARWVRRHVPFVTLKAGVSLDGRIAPPRTSEASGHVTYLTGARSLLAVQKLRHAADAVLTGVGTVLEDNPLLTDRSGHARRRRLLRVILDSELRLPLRSQLVASAEDDLLVFTAKRPGDDEHAQRCAALVHAGVIVESVPSMTLGSLDIEAILKRLGGHYQVLNLLVEGGSRLNRTLLLGAGDGSPLADKLCLFYAPVFLGATGVPLIAGDAPLLVELRRAVITESGLDFRMEAYLRDPWHER